MDRNNYELYLRHISHRLVEQAFTTKREADPPVGNYDPYNSGCLMAYHGVIYFIKLHAPYSGLSQEDIGLAGIDPEADLLSLRPRELWEEEKIFEDKSFAFYVRYVCNNLVKEALEAKIEADQSKNRDGGSFDAGTLEGYREMICILKEEASKFDLDQKDIGLASVDPEVDLQLP